jgi:NADPH:quinone reductase-like Zn-dependent oxidoreductase
MKCLREFGICCNTGILGGMEYVPEFDPIKTIPNNRYLTSFFSNYPTQEIMDRLFQFVIDNDISPKIGKIFTDLDEISQAHKLMESNEAQGKIIFRLI